MYKLDYGHFGLKGFGNRGGLRLEDRFSLRDLSVLRSLFSHKANLNNVKFGFLLKHF